MIPKPTKLKKKRPNGHENMLANADRIADGVWRDREMGRHFTVKTWRRVYGDLTTCEECKRPFVFQKYKGKHAKGRFCSSRCIYRSTTNPSIRRVLKSGRVDEGALDQLFSEWVRTVGHCEAAGSRLTFACSGRLECCHIVSRIYRGTRWDRLNAVCMCAAHHKFFTHRPIEWREFIADKFGPEYLPALETKARPITKISPEARYETWVSMRAVVKAMRGE